MSHELHNLVTKIENACDPEFYEIADTEHLVRLAVAEYVVAQNGLVASARNVDPTAAQTVIDRHIRENISAGDPRTWFANVATKIADFLELAYEGKISNEASADLDLLPIGHPRNIKNLGLTATARMQAVADWVAADPRITSDLGRQAVYSAYSAKPDSVEATYANAKIEALCAAGVLPQDFAYEAIVASFKNMSFAERSARSKALAAVRRRDRWKRFANEFGRLRGFFSKGDGTMFSATGKIAGAVPGENKYYVEYDGSDPDIPKGIYIQDAGKSENVRALLSKRALGNATNLRKPLSEFDKRDQDSAVDLNEFLATKVESPGDWTKNKDGSFTSKTGNTLKEVKELPEGDYYFEGVGENNEQDLGEPLFEIRDANGDLVGVAQDWNGVQKIALTHDKMKEKEANKAPEINDQTFAEALDGLEDQTNWDDPDGEPSYESPNGVLSISFSADADTDGEGGMQDMSGWSATLDPDGEAIDLGSWRGGPDDDLGDIAERVSKAYEEYKAEKAGETKPAEPEAVAPAKVTTPTEKSKPSYLDQKPKSQQSTLKKYSQGYISDGNQDINVDITKNEDGTYTVDHGYTFLPDENATEIQFDEGAKTFESEKEALDFANEKLAYYNSRRVDEDAATDAFERTLDSAPPRERGLGQDVPEEAPAKEAKPLSEKQMEPATPKQYALLKEFQEERDGIDENQNQAINDALEKQNLSKAQMASLFGDLQKKPFKPEIDPTKPSDRMINSLRDYLTNKELTTDELNSALDELEAGLDRAGMEKLIAKLRRRPDKAKEEGLGQDVPSGLSPQQLANGFWFDKSSDGKTWSGEGGGLDPVTVDVTEINGKWTTTEFSGGNNETGFTREVQKQHGSAQEAFEYAAEVANHSWDQALFDDLNSEQGLGQAVPSTKMAEDATDAQYNYVSSMLNGKDVPEELATAAQQAIEDRNLSKAQIGEIIGKMRDLPNKEGFDPNAPTERMIESVKRNIVAKGLSEEDQAAILEDLPKMDKATMSELIGRLKAMDDVNTPEQGLGQESGSDVDQIAADVDALESIAYNGDELKSYVNEFKTTDNLTNASESLDAIRAMADNLRDPEVSTKLDTLADELENELISRFGVAEAARSNGDQSVIDLGDATDAIQAEKDMFFETDPDVLADKLTSSDSYGDSRSGGAEVFISEENGVFTAVVDYDLDSEEFKGEDRDEVVQKAANAAADYNRDVIPSSYFEGANLEKEAQDAKSDEEALALVDKLVQLANDLENNRGDLDLAGELKDYADRIEALVAKRKSQAPEQGLGQQADSNESTAAQAARANRAQDIALDKLPADASDEELEMEASDIESKLLAIDNLVADNDRLGLRELELNSDYQDVRAEINEAKRKVDAQMDKADAAKNAEIDDAIASADINKLENLLDDPDFDGFDLIIKEAIEELKASEEGLGQELPKA